MKHPEPAVRAAAMHVAWRADDKVLSNGLRDGGWTASSAQGDEALHGSLALCCAEPIEGDDRPGRIIPLAIGFLTRAWPDEASYAEAFARHVEGRVDRELNPPRSSQGFGYGIDDRASYRKLVEGAPEKVEQWVAPALNGVALNVGIMLFSADQAIIEITRVLLALDRPSGATLWRALVKSLDESSAKSDGLRLMPFEVPANATTQALRLAGLASANLDEHLFDTASALRRGAESDWLVDAVRRMLASTVYDAARALVLAGELDCDEKADALWTEIRAYDLAQWLSDVREHSHGRYVANVRAKGWLRAFIEAADPVEAFSAFELFRMTAGRTAGRWATSMMDEAKDLISTRKYDHWRLNVPSLNAAINANAKAAKDHLAYTRVPRYEQAPWR
jgi:hypothetical protein